MFRKEKQRHEGKMDWYRGNHIWGSLDDDVFVSRLLRACNDCSRIRLHFDCGIWIRSIRFLKQVQMGNSSCGASCRYVHYRQCRKVADYFGPWRFQNHDLGSTTDVCLGTFFLWP